MKACGRTLKSTMAKCGELFDGPGSYCRSCRNDYQREYYAKRKDPFYKSVQEDLGSSCQACATALRSNTIARIDQEGLEKSVVLCETCRAVVVYLSEKVDEAAQEFLVALAMELSDLRYGDASIVNAINSTSHTDRTSTPYVPELTMPPRKCDMCELPAEPGKEYCTKHSYLGDAVDELVSGRDIK